MLFGRAAEDLVEAEAVVQKERSPRVGDQK